MIEVIWDEKRVKFEKAGEFTSLQIRFFLIIQSMSVVSDSPRLSSVVNGGLEGAESRRTKPRDNNHGGNNHGIVCMTYYLCGGSAPEPPFSTIG